MLWMVGGATFAILLGAELARVVRGHLRERDGVRRYAAYSVHDAACAVALVEIGAETDVELAGDDRPPPPWPAATPLDRAAERASADRSTRIPLDCD